MERALRDLDVEEILRHVVRAADAFDLREHVPELEVDARKIHRNVRRLPARPRAAFHLVLADALDRVEVEPVDEVRVLQHGDERARRDDAAHRVAPARERLEAADLPRGGADLRLVPDLDPALAERAVKIRHDVRLEAALLLHRGVEVRDLAVVHPLDAVARELRAVEDERDVRDVRRRRVDADLHAQEDARLGLLDRLDDGLDVRVEVLPARHHDEAVAAEARHRHGAERAFEGARDAHEQMVACLESKFLIHDTEIFNIEVKERRRPQRKTASRLLHESHHGREPRQLVAPFLPQEPSESLRFLLPVHGVTSLRTPTTASRSPSLGEGG